MTYLSISSPLGSLTIFEEGGKIVALEWGRANKLKIQSKKGPLEKAHSQLNDYFDGTLKKFDLPLAPKGSEFQQGVWRWLRQIPYGQTRTYKEGALTVDSGPRAVGGACGRNPIPIIIPCHRVLEVNGRLGGFSAFSGLETKKVLLNLERSLNF